jgi:hypothetical protein
LDARQPGESELDYRYRIGQQKRAADAKAQMAALQKYQPATEKIARDIATQVQTALDDIVGRTEVTVHNPRPARADIPPKNATTNVTLTAKSKNAPHEATITVVVTSAMQGSELPEEMSYSLAGGMSYNAGGNINTGLPLPVSKSNPQRPDLDIQQLVKTIRRLAGLGP